MPIISIAVAAPANPSLSAQIAASMTELTRLHLRKDPTVTAVTISYIDPQHWFAGGRSIASQETASFWLDIKVVDGTNTKQELASYIEAVYAGFESLLGTVHPESYVFVHEVAAAAYGFGGKTQEFRFISGKLQPAA
ncbi:hypothetical protein SAMCCGM7_Ch2099 [Sinorhizobium americanum CCGM7]|uniref:tautomerase family protein n=1 Tax=Sinorhizobium americanum TaxID=194963 RepID=UPI0004D4555E|nr:4-oxalocrotonate tautomerase family protein [Sinorhizobium americanum]APG84844.1 hypothetical protein SAMCCGM7_Ch2099 [Sinorhizobium americanum CCGM7]